MTLLIPLAAAMQGSGKSSGAITAVWPATIASGSLVAQHVAGKATRDTLFLTHFGLGALSGAMIGAALVSPVSVIGISRALRRWGPARVIPALFALSAFWSLVNERARDEDPRQGRRRRRCCRSCSSAAGRP